MSGKLTVVGVVDGRTHYALDGVFGFVSFETTPLRRGDQVRDNRGNGMIAYANQCCSCDRIFLAGTMILVPTRCRTCSRDPRW